MAIVAPQARIARREGLTGIRLTLDQALGRESGIGQRIRHWAAQTSNPRVVAEASGQDEDCSREPEAVPQPRAYPGHPREPGADSTVLSRFISYGDH